jgi:TonB C terminal
MAIDPALVRTERPVVRRRPRKPTPLRSLRLGAAARSTAPPRMPFPGILIPEPELGRGRIVSGLISGGLHLSLFAAIFLVAWLAPEIEHDEVIPVRILHEALQETAKPAPEPAPAPKALAERRSLKFNPAAQAVAPQVVNPTVVAQAAPAVRAERIDVDAIATHAAPQQISRSAVAVEAVKAVTSVAAAAPTQVDVTDAAAPALRGPIQAAAPVGPSVGPKQIASGSPENVGTGSELVTDPGSSVREGELSTRDVLGSPDGPRLASVNTRVGTGHLRGPGGTGTTLGGVAPDCDSRPEVRAYMDQIRQRTVSRWAPPPGTKIGSVTAKLRFRIDPGGSATKVELVSAPDSRLGETVVDALRSASPFPPMSDPVRCLANTNLVATFILSTEGS